MSSQSGDRALVLGGSIAGLLAARVLSESFAEVLVVDRDKLTEVTGPRRAVPQGNHIHALLARGQQILEELFPGFTDELVAGGAPIGDFNSNLRWYFDGVQLKQAETGLVCIGAGRVLLEGTIRGRIAAIPNVRVRDRTDIIGLTTTAAGDVVTGARVQSQEPGSAVEVMTADLVVDATGRGSRTTRWLEELGYPSVEEEHVKMGLTYTTRNFKVDPDADGLGHDIASIPVATPKFPRGAIYARMPEFYSVSLTGILGERPPTDPEGFMEYVKSLPAPEIYEAVRDAEPVGDAMTFHFPASIRKHYERMRRFPGGLIVVGDAAAVFNPVYGQGMTVAAIEAMVLRDHLRGGAVKPLAFFQQQSASIDDPWDMSAGSDLGFPGVEGRRTAQIRMANVILPRLHKAAATDSDLTSAFLRVAGLTVPLDTLLSKEFMARTFRPAGATKA